MIIIYHHFYFVKKVFFRIPIMKSLQKTYHSTDTDIALRIAYELRELFRRISLIKLNPLILNSRKMRRMLSDVCITMTHSNFTIDKFRFIGYNNSGDKLRLIVWKLYVSVKRGSPCRIKWEFYE